ARRRHRSPVRRPRLGGVPPPPRRGSRGPGGLGGEVSEPVTSKRITVEVNGETYEHEVEARRLLVHFLRDDLELTGTHIGCDTGNCGACTVLCDGSAIKSCMMLAVQAEGHRIETIESLAGDGALHALQQAFSTHHALQCGYCTPGMLMSAKG